MKATRKLPVELAQSISSIPPWSSEVDYSPGEWDRILEVADELNEAETDDTRRALDMFTESAAHDYGTNYLEISKAFILLRVMFRFPERERHATSLHGGWIADESALSPGWP